MSAVDEGIERIADLLAARNAVDSEIATITGRPMTSGHLGEWLAANIFDLELERSATTAGVDGAFRAGPLAGSTVNVKWYLKREGLLDLTAPGPDLYLVLTGPRATPASSRGQVRPWCVEAVYLFDGHALLQAQRARGVKIGTASSVPTAHWDGAAIFPRPNSPLLAVTDRQRAALQRLSLAAFSGGHA